VREAPVRKQLAILILCLAATLSAAQTPAPSKFERGTIMSVKPHQETGAATDPSVERFDVDVKVKNTMYTVLFTQGAGKYGIQYRAGLDLFVLVKDKTIAYNDLLGETREVPIINRKPVTANRNNKTVADQSKQ